MDKKIERIAIIALAAFLVWMFIYQVAYGAKETCSGFIDKGKCLTLEKTPYYFGYYGGKQGGLITFFQVDDNCDSASPIHRGI